MVLPVKVLTKICIDIVVSEVLFRGGGGKGEESLVSYTNKKKREDTMKALIEREILEIDLRVRLRQRQREDK